MIYNKEQKDHRKLKASGPRNMQARDVGVGTSEDIKELRAEITKLASTNTLSTGGYTQQQVDDMLNGAIEEVSVDLEKKYLKDIRELTRFLEDSKNEVSDLKAKLDKKEEVISTKDSVILELTTKITELSSRSVTVLQALAETVEEEPNRPSMGSVFIDPSKKGAEDKMESYVKIKEVKNNDGAKVGANINKLKNLMGKLPKK